ncbi:MAG: hypothetical protein ABIE70_11030 [bacterium]
MNWSWGSKRSTIVVVMSVALTACLMPTASAQQPGDSGIVMDWQVMAVSVSNASSANYGISLTGGEPAVGIGSSENYGVSGGFWTVSEEIGCCEIRADINHDGAGPDIADLVYLVNYMFNGGQEPPCSEDGYFAEADANGDMAGPDIADLVYLVNYMFNGGPPPAPCG